MIHLSPVSGSISLSPTIGLYITTLKLVGGRHPRDSNAVITYEVYDFKGRNYEHIKLSTFYPFGSVRDYQLGMVIKLSVKPPLCINKFPVEVTYFLAKILKVDRKFYSFITLK